MSLISETLDSVNFSLLLHCSIVRSGMCEISLFSAYFWSRLIIFIGTGSQKQSKKFFNSISISSASLSICQWVLFLDICPFGVGFVYSLFFVPSFLYMYKMKNRTLINTGTLDCLILTNSNNSFVHFFLLYDTNSTFYTHIFHFTRHHASLQLHFTS